MRYIKRLFKHKSVSGKRGFTVAEAVIAMAVIVIVTVSAAAVIKMSASSTSHDFDYERARVSVKNAMEYYKYDENQLIDYLINEGFQNGNGYVKQFGDFTVTITVIPAQNNQSTFSALIVDGKGNTKLDINNYTKGG